MPSRFSRTTPVAGWGDSLPPLLKSPKYSFEATEFVNWLTVKSWRSFLPPVEGFFKSNEKLTKITDDSNSTTIAPCNGSMQRVYGGSVGRRGQRLRLKTVFLSGRPTSHTNNISLTLPVAPLLWLFVSSPVCVRLSTLPLPVRSTR